MASEKTNPANQQFNLRWNNHTNNILQVFAEQLSSESLVDVTISCQGKFIKAHKMVLSACSPYFQELFKMHQAQHPVIIINGMSFCDVKLVIEFMYRGEVKVQENDLSNLLLAAETLQVKGLSNVRNKYEKRQMQELDTLDNHRHSPSVQSEANSHNLRKSLDEEGLRSQTPSEESHQKDCETRSRSMSPTCSHQDFDDDLPATIKVEPPDIRDIDEEEPIAGWDSPRLIIDMKEPKEEGKNLELVERKRPNILRQLVPSIRVASAQHELSGEDKVKQKREMPVPQTSAAARFGHFIWPKKPQTIIGKWNRAKLCKIPRPPNAFMIFANDWRRKLALEYPVESNKEISVRLGTMWKNLDADSKETYYSAARKADEEHKLKYPGYYYSPKEARMRKGLKRRNAVTTGNVDALRFVKVYMTSSEKASLESKSATLFRELLPKPNHIEEMDTSAGQVATEVVENGVVQKPTMDSGESENNQDPEINVMKNETDELIEIS